MSQPAKVIGPRLEEAKFINNLSLEKLCSSFLPKPSVCMSTQLVLQNLINTIALGKSDVIVVA
jgi:hypothetical protein